MTNRYDEMITINLRESQVDTVLAALLMADTRYNTKHNGGAFMDFSFKTIEDQNAYAQHFADVDSDIRKQINKQSVANHQSV